MSIRGFSRPKSREWIETPTVPSSRWQPVEKTAGAGHLRRYSVLAQPPVYLIFFGFCALCALCPAIPATHFNLVAALRTAPAAAMHGREAALDLLAELPGKHRKTVGGDKGYDTFGFVEECRAMNTMPHVAMNDARRDGSALDVRTTRHAGYAINQCKRKMVETTFWLGKTIQRTATHDVSRAESSEWHGYLDGDGVQFSANSELAAGVGEMRWKMACECQPGFEKGKKWTIRGSFLVEPEKIAEN